MHVVQTTAAKPRLNHRLASKVAAGPLLEECMLDRWLLNLLDYVPVLDARLKSRSSLPIEDLRMPVSVR